MEDRAALLGVNCSLLGRRWLERRYDAEQLRAMTQHGISEILARVLAARKVKVEESATHLNPRLRDLMPNPSNLRQMDEAVDCFLNAIKKERKIGIYSDFDADGACSCAMLNRYLSTLGITAEFYIPVREREGFGPSKEGFELLRNRGVELVVLTDFGVSSPEEVMAAKEMGLDLLIFDHHKFVENFPVEACAVVNPRHPDDSSGLDYLASAGIVFLFLVACNRAIRNRRGFIDVCEPDLLSLLDLVALATICDVVPLVKLNRAFVRQGLSVFQNSGNLGLNALARKAGLEGEIGTRDFGFALGPRINAAGRVGNPELAVQLLCTHDAREAEVWAEKLHRLNQWRQEIESRVTAHAIKRIEAREGQHDPVLFVSDAHWHPGVIGIVASRLKERYRRTSVVVGSGVDADKLRGSCRSVASFDIGKVVLEAYEEGFLVNGGGHPMAAGFTIRKECLMDFQAFVQERAKQARVEEEKDYYLDGVMGMRAADLEKQDQLERGGPYGKDNEAPSFAFDSVRVVRSKIFGRDLNHVSCLLSGRDGARLSAMAFHVASSPVGEALSCTGDRRLHVAGQLEASQWRGRRRLRLLVEDVAECA